MFGFIDVLIGKTTSISFDPSKNLYALKLVDYQIGDLDTIDNIVRRRADLKKTLGKFIVDIYSQVC